MSLPDLPLSSLTLEPRSPSLGAQVWSLQHVRRAVFADLNRYDLVQCALIDRDSFSDAISKLYNFYRTSKGKKGPEYCRCVKYLDIPHDELYARGLLDILDEFPNLFLIGTFRLRIEFPSFSSAAPRVVDLFPQAGVDLDNYPPGFFDMITALPEGWEIWVGIRLRVDDVCVRTKRPTHAWDSEKAEKRLAPRARFRYDSVRVEVGPKEGLQALERVRERLERTEELFIDSNAWKAADLTLLADLLPAVHKVFVRTTPDVTMDWRVFTSLKELVLWYPTLDIPTPQPVGGQQQLGRPLDHFSVELRYTSTSYILLKARMPPVEEVSRWMLSVGGQGCEYRVLVSVDDDDEEEEGDEWVLAQEWDGGRFTAQDAVRGFRAVSEDYTLMVNQQIESLRRR